MLVVTSNMVPAHPHATSVAVYPTLFYYRQIFVTLGSVIARCYLFLVVKKRFFKRLSPSIGQSVVIELEILKTHFWDLGDKWVMHALGERNIEFTSNIFLFLMLLKNV